MIENYELLSSFGRVAPPSDYLWKDDQLVGVAKGQIFGWEIPNLIVTDIPGEKKYFEFAKMLLSGKIIPSFTIL